MTKLPALWAPLQSLWHNRSLILQLTRREIVARHKGSILGLTWVFLLPLIMLTVYTFIFSMVFKARWDVAPGSRFEFALILFSGLITYTIFSECLIKAPTLVLNNPAFVKKVVFPIEILPWISMATSLFYAATNLLVLCIFQIFVMGGLHWTALLYPLVLLPLILFCMGLTWLLASLGVFVRDIGPLVGVIASIMMFLSPIFYPLSAVPPEFQSLLLLNPLTFVIEESRHVLLWGQLIQWKLFSIYLIASIGCAWLGFTWFEKTRKGFADVI